MLWLTTEYKRTNKVFLKGMLYTLVPLLGIGCAYLLGRSFHLGIAFALLAIGSAILLFCIAYPKFGFYLNTAYVFFIFFFQRLLNVDLHVGATPKLFIIAIFIGVLLKKIIHRQKIWNHAGNPITYVYLANILYIGIEAFNPNINSLAGWVPVFTGTIFVFIYYLIAIYLFDSKREIKFFLKFWLILAIISAFYGCYQQWFGLPKWEYQRLIADPHTFALFYQNGFIRKYSFMSDPPSFGILMAVTGIMALCLALGNLSSKKRLLLILSGIIMILSMSYSGTRMATALIPFGLLFFGMLTIQNRKTIILLATTFIVGVVIIFMPVYGNGVLVRVRSTFHPQEDASMQVRELNRKKIQPYMHSHPMGGGIGTTGNAGLKNYPNHPLAGFPPDGSYLHTALELGWIGFLLGLSVLFVILKYGVHQYFRSKNPETKIIYAAVLTAIFCWYMAKYSQIGSGAFNSLYLYIPSLALLARLHTFDKIAE